MVFLILTKEGFKDLGRFLKENKHPIWVNQGVLSQAEIEDLRASGINLTDFTYHISIDDQKEINEAINTISEHHPGERIWIEYQSQT
jgi:hypothetical protein